MAIAIFEATITKDDGGATVRLHIGDAPLDDERASFRLELAVRLAPSHSLQSLSLSQIQRQAVLEAHDALRALAETLPVRQSPV